jgi:hypothetical protein
MNQKLTAAVQVVLPPILWNAILGFEYTITQKL